MQPPFCTRAALIVRCSSRRQTSCSRLERARATAMKAMVLRGPNTPFELAEVPDPVAGPGEAVARVITCGSGLTIQHIKAGRTKGEKNSGLRVRRHGVQRG